MFYKLESFIFGVTTRSSDEKKIVSVIKREREEKRERKKGWILDLNSYKFVSR